MLVVTPKKYQNLSNDEVRKSYQSLIDTILDFKEEHPHATLKDLNIYAIGVVKGRTKHTSERRN